VPLSCCHTRGPKPANVGCQDFIPYNASFELECLKECCGLSPEFKPWLPKVTQRVVDLLLPFRGYHYYHPQQNGSASNKAVLRALSGQGCDGLAIQEAASPSKNGLAS
jgi:hypothetical protein